jgi:hypothetical protein
MNLAEFLNTPNHPRTFYLVSCPGGYFRERTMSNTYLIGTIEQAGVITTQRIANLTAAMIGDGAELLTIKITKA